MKWLPKKTVDERQEKELRTIESVAYWVMLWSLALCIIIQVFIFKARLPQLAGELITLGIGTVAALAGYVNKGEWSYFSNPSWKSYAATGIVLALMAAFIFGFMVKTESRLRFLLIGVVIAFFTGFLGTAVLGYFTKKRREKLEKTFDIDK